MSDETELEEFNRLHWLPSQPWYQRLLYAVFPSLFRRRISKVQKKAQEAEDDAHLEAQCNKADAWEDFSDTWGCGEHSQDLDYDQMKAKFEREYALHGPDMVY